MKMGSELPSADARSRGFTLVELLVSMAIVMIILAGLYSNVLMQSRVQSSQASTVDVLEDLRLTSQIMSSQMRLAVNLCWDGTNNRIIYQPLGATTMDAAGCKATYSPPSYTVDPTWGYFQFKTGTPATGGEVCWKGPNSGAGCQEMMRGLDTASGMQVSPTSNTNLAALRTMTLNSQYKSVDRTNRNLRLNFDVLPRNN